MGGVLGVVVVLAVIAFIVLIGLFCIPRNTKVAHEDDEKVYYNYRSVPGKRPWALNHKPSFFTILGACPVYWALTVCKQLKEARSTVMGVALARVRARAHMPALYRVRLYDF